MFEEVDKILCRFVELNRAELSLFHEHLNEITVKRNEHILEKGKVADKIYFIIEGVIEMYMINEAGLDVSIDFFTSGENVTDYVSYLTEQHSEMYLRALKKSKLYYIKKDAMEMLFNESISFMKIGKLISDYHFLSLVERIRSTSLSPKEKYEKLMQEKPHWGQCIPQYKLASYLNISAEWLSKIRSLK